jgi:WD40 repeat protein
MLSHSAVEIEKLHTFTGHRDAVYGLIRLSDTEFISAAGDGLMVRWNINEPDKGKVLAKADASVYALERSVYNEEEILFGQNYDGLRLVTLADEIKTQSINLTTKAIFAIAEWQQYILVGTGGGELFILERNPLRVAKKLQLSDKSLRCLAVHPNRPELAAGFSDHSIRILDTKNWAVKQEISAHTNSVFSLAYSPNGEQLITTGRDAHLKFWNAGRAYEPEQEIVAHMYAINHLTFRPDGAYFATASMDKSIKLWQAKPARLLKVIDKARHAGHGTSVNRLLWLNESTLISASDDRTISVWSVQL